MEGFLGLTNFGICSEDRRLLFNGTLEDAKQTDIPEVKTFFEVGKF